MEKSYKCVSCNKRRKNVWYNKKTDKIVCVDCVLEKLKNTDAYYKIIDEFIGE